jgi:hypothetical protein
MGSVSVPASTGDPEVHGLAPRIHPWAVRVSIPPRWDEKAEPSDSRAHRHSPVVFMA